MRQGTGRVTAESLHKARQGALVLGQYVRDAYRAHAGSSPDPSPLLAEYARMVSAHRAQ